MIIRLDSEETTCNSYLVIEDSAVLLIDVSDTDKIRRLITAHNWTLEKILLTHEHVDHIVGLEQIRSLTDAPVISCTACSSRIGIPKQNLSTFYDLLVYAYTGTICKNRHDSFSCRPCEVTFQDHLTISWHKHIFRLYRCPGHSPGSTLICMDDDCAFTGDYLLPDMPVNLSLSGGNEEDYKNHTLPVLENCLHSGMMIFPGHGKPYTFCAEKTAHV